jgi:hypothetical protein
MLKFHFRNPNDSTVYHNETDPLLDLPLCSSTLIKLHSAHLP